MLFVCSLFFLKSELESFWQLAQCFCTIRPQKSAGLKLSSQQLYFNYNWPSRMSLFSVCLQIGSIVGICIQIST
jgi:hypothetical protein